jgi:nucleoside-diphosphate-sugar epimerase
MAYYKFSKLNKENKVVNIYNKGNMFRDFTYVTDIISAINKVIKIKIKEKNLILNIGKGKPNKLIELIKLLEKYQNSPSISILANRLSFADKQIIYLKNLTARSSENSVASLSNSFNFLHNGINCSHCCIK